MSHSSLGPVAMMIGAALMTQVVSSLTLCNNLCRHHHRPRAAHHYYTTQLQSSKVPIISTRSSSSGGSNSNIQNSKTRRRKHYYIVPCYNETTALLNDRTLFDDDDDYDDDNPTMKRYLETRASPFPTMPSPLFTNLAQAQFELLSNSLVHNTIIDDITTTSSSSNTTTTTTTTKNTIKPGTTKISSMALYLPKENSHTGQLEFVPAVTYPNPLSERVFIARDSSNSGIHQPPVIPSMAILGLPGFFQAKDLIPTYPFVSSSPLDDEEDDDDGGTNSNNNDEKAQRREMMFTTASPDSKIGVSVVEEIPPSVGSVLSSSSSKTSNTNEENNNNTNVVPPLSVTLFSGLETLGVLMIWPNKGRDGSNNKSMMSQWKWSSNDKLQVSRAAKSLALALSMDKERVSTQISSEQFQVAMADSLHQVKSPLQALRTFGKLLQRQLAEENASATSSSSTAVGPTIRRQRQMVKLAENMAAQGERVVDLIQPMDTLVNGRSNYLLRGDVKQKVPQTGVVLRSNFLLPNGSNYGVPASTTTTTTTTSAADADAAAALESVQSSPVLGDFQMELAFPQDVLGSTVYASQMVSREKGINFDAVGFEPDAELPACLVSSKQLQEAISNVLDNAIKYAPRRRKGPGRPRIPQVKVSIVANEPPFAAGCTIWVEDNGPGIPEAELESVFERGYRSKEIRDEVEGSGLGLTVAKFWLNQMGGRIDVVEEGGPSKLQGTTVRVILFRDPET